MTPPRLTFDRYLGLARLLPAWLRCWLFGRLPSRWQTSCWDEQAWDEIARRP